MFKSLRKELIQVIDEELKRHKKEVLKIPDQSAENEATQFANSFLHDDSPLGDKAPTFIVNNYLPQPHFQFSFSDEYQINNARVWLTSDNKVGIVGINYVELYDDDTVDDLGYDFYHFKYRVSGRGHAVDGIFDDEVKRELKKAYEGYLAELILLGQE